MPFKNTEFLFFSMKTKLPENENIWKQNLTSNCEICNLNKAAYRCPRCGIAYCGLSCFQSHNSKCVNNFSNNKLNSMKAPKVSSESRLQMMHTLENYENNEGEIINTEDVEPWTAWWEKSIICNAPKPEFPAPPSSSPLLPYHLVNILYGYCYTMRLYNGDVSFDFEGACDVLVQISTVLSSKEVLNSVKNALSRCIEQSRQVDLFVEYQWQVEVVKDVELCLTTKSHLDRALSEMIVITKEAKDKFAMKKLQFFFAWSQTLTKTLIEKLQEEVHQYYTSLNSLLFDVYTKSLKS